MIRIKDEQQIKATKNEGEFLPVTVSYTILRASRSQAAIQV